MRVMSEKVRDVRHTEDDSAEFIRRVGRLIGVLTANGEGLGVKRGIAAIPGEKSMWLVGVEAAEVAAEASRRWAAARAAEADIAAAGAAETAASGVGATDFEAAPEVDSSEGVGEASLSGDGDGVTGEVGVSGGGGESGAGDGGCAGGSGDEAGGRAIEGKALCTAA